MPALIAAIIMLFTCPMPAAHAQADFIKWVDFNVPSSVLKKACEYDAAAMGKNPQHKMEVSLAYLAAKNGNKFKSTRDLAALKDYISKTADGQTTAQELLGSSKYFEHYREAYGAVFAGFISPYIDGGQQPGYGLTAYFPLAKGFWFSGYDDFGNARSFGFKRKHLGHDIFGSTGTPVIAVEGGTITELGWNQYGGWRVGVRSHDTKRYYYYAHLRKNKPYAAGLEKGSTVTAGQVIGYLGATGYSRTENKNMKTRPHLHFGMQLIFDESQVKGNGEIWIDVYSICALLESNRATVQKDEQTGEYQSINLKQVIAREGS